ncbi:Lipopolysaccharide assembly protein A [Thalassocella blandensis]|nr:Lipopolysaccharide assembly protein A [Thalassocella blandensis]
MLKWPKRMIQIIWYLLMMLLGIGIAIYNPEPVTIKFFLEWQLADIRLGIVLCGILMLGGFLGYFTAQVSVWQQKRKTRKAEKEVKKLKSVQQTDASAELLPQTPKAEHADKSKAVAPA